MAQDETELQMVQRHVRQGTAHLQRQHEIVVWLKAKGHPTETAETFLSQLADLQQLHEAHLARLERAETPSNKVGHHGTGCAEGS